MKLTFTILFLFAICQQNFSQETEIKTKLELLSLKSIENDKLVDYDLLRRTENKIIMIEFWETWCGACIVNMHHLKILQDKYANDLQIICVASDDLKKTLNFIKKNSYPFDFIFDEEKKLTELFPHSSKPFTVIIDKNGIIRAETNPSFISETQIEQLILGQSIDVPFVKNFNAADLEKEKSETPLVSFVLQRHELGEKSYLSTTKSVGNKVKIITGYDSNSFIDTVETIEGFVASSKNILELYQIAYNNISETNFFYCDDLNYIKSHQPNHLYKLNFSASSLLDESNSLLINQLNSSFGLSTQRIKKDTTVLVLKKVTLNGKSIKLADDKKKSSAESDISTYQFFKVSGNGIDTHDLAKLIGKKTELLVLVENPERIIYELNIDMDKAGGSIDEWIDYFKQEGIHLAKGKRVVEFIKIKKASHNTL